jgi:MinD-like ATPase involved in chromosome partitioning or flagellar assembly
MARIVAVHSYRGGTGKSHTAANLAVLLAGQGLRVALVDTDVQTPGLHTLFGMRPPQMPFGLSDYLIAECEIGDAVYELSHLLPPQRPSETTAGALFVLPSRVHETTVVQMAAQGYDIALLNAGLQHLQQELNLDAMLLDTHPGMNSETMLALAIADTLAVVVRPDQQEFEGARMSQMMTLRSTRPRTLVIVNMLPESVDGDLVRDRALDAYSGDQAAVLPYCDEFAGLAGGELFVLRYPDHEITQLLTEIAGGLGFESSSDHGSR